MYTLYNTTNYKFHEPALRIQYNSTYSDAGYADRLGASGKSVENSTKLTCLENTGYLIKYSTVLGLLGLQIRCGRKV